MPTYTLKNKATGKIFETDSASKKKLKSWGKKREIIDSNISKLILETFGGIKDILILGRKNYFEKYFLKVAELMKNTKYPKIYEILEKVMLERKNIHPNVDYPTGPTYHLMGFDTDFFTPIFVISRITGWSAHIMEQHAANKLIRPLASYKGNKHRKVLQLNQR